jgi:hypothetical protein
MRKYFICSVGEPGKGYDDSILRLCMVHSCFVLHKSTKNKGSIHEIEPGDILVLKYQTNFVGYGRAISGLDTNHDLGDGWSWTVRVNTWIMGSHVGRYGIKEAQKSGTAYDTVKIVDRGFALGKLEEIGFPF